MFLACARACNPQKNFHLEFAPISRIDKLNSLLYENGFFFSKTNRRNETILYTGNSTTAEDFFAAIGMNSTAFLLMNSKIENEFMDLFDQLSK